MNVNYVDVAVLIGGNTYKQYRYLRNENLETSMINKLTDFWRNNVEPKIPPEVKNRRDVEKLFQPESDKVLEANDDLAKELIHLASLKQVSSETEENIEKLQDKICAQLKDASVVVDKLGEKICTYKNVVTNRFDSTSFKKDNLPLYEKYQKPSCSRVFRLNPAYKPEV
jgi:predicted phage-related endonuclease